MNDPAASSSPSPPPSLAPNKAKQQDPALLAARLKERIYATITVIAVLMGLAYTQTLGPVDAAVTVAVTCLGLWAASVAADAQTHQIVHGHHLDGKQLWQALFVASPLLLSAVGPLVLIAFAGLGVMALDTALLTAAWLGVATLFVWGWYGGRQMGDSTAAALLLGSMNAVIGALIAVVKAAGH